VIALLRGRLAWKRPPRVLVEVGGVGYELEAPLSTVFRLPAVGEEVLLHTHLLVRDDALQLYGFATQEERGLFRELLRVSGVGPRLAVAILSGLSPAELRRCLREGDTAALTRLPGVGRKTAARLVVELRERLGGEAAEGPAPAGAAGAGMEAPERDAEAALESLGYAPAEARRLVRRALREAARG